MNNWIRKTLQNFLRIEEFSVKDKEYIEKALRNEIQSIIAHFLDKDNNSTYCYHRDKLVWQFSEMVSESIKRQKKDEIKIQIEEIIKEMKINQEKFLDEVVVRLRNKQLGK